MSNQHSHNPFNTIELADPAIVQMCEDAANQMNKSRGFVFEDLSNHIADIRFTWTSQGASTLVIDIIDPNWALCTPIKALGYQAFIDIDPDGFLYDVTIELPVGSGHIWHLEAADTNLDPSQANLTLTFEDAVIQKLRTHGASSTDAINSLPNETRLEFIQRICKMANVQTVQWFSEQTKNFEKPPQPTTPQQIKAWNKHFNQQFDQNFNKKFNAAFDKRWLEQQKAYLEQIAIRGRSANMHNVGGLQNTSITPGEILGPPGSGVHYHG